MTFSQPDQAAIFKFDPKAIETTTIIYHFVNSTGQVSAVLESFPEGQRQNRSMQIGHLRIPT